MASDECVTKYEWQKINDSINKTVNEIKLMSFGKKKAKNRIRRVLSTENAVTLEKEGRVM